MAEKRVLLRKQIYLDRRLEERLKLAAKRSRLTESAIIRRALEEYLDEEDRRCTPAESKGSAFRTSPPSIDISFCLA
ncbi:MAG: ribbon-helix-helix domain-containing protein [Bacillota bacterium]